MPPFDKATLDTRIGAIIAETNVKVRAKLFEDLAQALGNTPTVLHAFAALAKQSPRLALGLVARMADPVAHGIVLQASPYLGSQKIPVFLRIAVAGKLLLALPDKAESVGPIIRSLTADCSRNKSLDRLLKLQNRLVTSTTLDQHVEVLLKTVRVKCPLCNARGNRMGLAKHLWAKHKKWVDSGVAVDSGKEIETAINAAATSAEPEVLDHAFLLSKTLYPNAPWHRVQQGLASRYWRTPEEYAPLCERAEEHHEGICPNCYANIPDPVPELPPALTLVDGRLRGDGYAVEVINTAVGRTFTITTPDHGPQLKPDVDAQFPPRLFALWVGMVAGVIALALLFLVKKDTVPPMVMAACGIALVALSYTATLLVRKTIPSTDSRAVDLAWQEVAPGVGRKPKAIRFLVRLCQASLGQGTPDERSGQVWELAEHALVLSKKGGIFGHLLAAASVLKAHDAAAMGRDVADTLTEALSPILLGEVPLSVGEAAARILNESNVLPATDSARLSIMLMAKAFEAGLTAADLFSLRGAAPAFANLVAPGPSVHLRNLNHLWTLRYTKPWGKIGDGEPIFDYVRQFPNAAGRLLKQNPDTLVVYRFENFLGDEVGMVAIRTAGVTWGGETMADPQGNLAVLAGRDGGGEVHFGRQIFVVSKRPSDGVERVLRGWLRYRATEFIPQSLAKPDKTTPAGQGIIATLNVRCHLCGVSSVTRSGQIGLLVN